MNTKPLLVGTLTDRQLGRMSIAVIYSPLVLLLVAALFVV